MASYAPLLMTADSAVNEDGAGIVRLPFVYFMNISQITSLHLLYRRLRQAETLNSDGDW